MQHCERLQIRSISCIFDDCQAKEIRYWAHASVSQSIFVQVLSCPISMGLGHIGTRTWGLNLSLYASVPMCIIVSHFHGARTYWDQDAEDWSLPVCSSPTVHQSHCVLFPWGWGTLGHCVPFSWGWDTLGPGRRGLISPCVHQSHFHGTGTQWDQGAWDWSLPVCTSPIVSKSHCARVILCTIPVVSQFCELVPLWAHCFPLCPISIMYQSHCLFSCLFMSCEVTNYISHAMSGAECLAFSSLWFTQQGVQV